MRRLTGLAVTADATVQQYVSALKAGPASWLAGTWNLVPCIAL